MTVHRILWHHQCSASSKGIFDKQQKANQTQQLIEKQNTFKQEIVNPVQGGNQKDDGAVTYLQATQK